MEWDRRCVSHGTVTSGPQASKPARRAIAYVDGFNLYYGLMDKGWGRYRWLDVRALVTEFVRPPSHLATVRYFTARSSHPPERFQRHTTYLRVLEKVCDVEIHEGRIQPRDRTCPACGHARRVNDEKQTDVNMALAMVTDAFDGRLDEAFLLSADSDLVPAVRMLQERWGIEVTLIDPPRRHSDELKAAATRRLRIPRNWISRSQIPNPAVYVHRGKERAIHRPELWGTNQPGSS